MLTGEEGSYRGDHGAWRSAACLYLREWALRFQDDPSMRSGLPALRDDLHSACIGPTRAFNPHSVAHRVTPLPTVPTMSCIPSR